MQPAESRHQPAAQAHHPMRDAFHELHGRRLHGFALLLLLGDAPRAAQLTVDALGAGSRKVDELRHPERAAAWLRARVVRSARGIRPSRGRAADRRQVLADIGADGRLASALEGLDLLERAAIIAGGIERLDPRDVAVVVGRTGRRLDRLIARARRRYGAAHADGIGEMVPGPVVERIRDVALRAMR